MDTSLKSRLAYGLFYVISVYLLAIAMLSAFDIINHKEFLPKNPYFKSYSFKSNLREYFESVQLMTVEQKESLSITDESDEGLKNKLFYEDVVQRINTRRTLKYYIKNIKSGEVFTNIENLKDINEYISKEAVYVENFPKESLKDAEYQYMNTWFQRNGFEGSFIFVKTAGVYSQMGEDYKYYNSIRERVIKESIIGSISLLAGAIILIFLKLKSRFEVRVLRTIKLGYGKMPLDSRTLIFIVYGVIMSYYLDGVYFFYMPIEKVHFVILTIVSIYVFYLMISIGSAFRLLNNKEELDMQLKNSLLYQIITLTRENIKIKGTLGTEFRLFLSTVQFGILITFGLLAIYSRNKFLFIFSFAYVIIYLMVVPVYVLKRMSALNRIIKGTDAIASGNLDYYIEESGDRNLRKLSKNINSMKEGFKKSVESQLKSERLKTELITNVSHDLKTPLTAIINYVSLLKKGGVSEEQSKKYAEVLEQKAQRLKVLIEDLFEASKVSSGSIELNIEKVDIASLLRQALGEFDEKITNSALTFRTNIPVEEVFLNLDGKRTWRVFENLIGNAIKYSQPNSRVYIDLYERAEKVIIIMKNMSSYEMDFDVEEIFERFKRGDKARSTEGSGLGLSIAKSLVELQGGEMSIDIDGDLFKVTVELPK